MPTEQAETMLGLSEREYNRQASAHCRQVIGVWLIGGIGYIVWADKFAGLSLLALFFPGIFVASFVAFVGFIVEKKAIRAVGASERGRMPGLAATGCVFVLLWWLVATLAAPACLAIVYVRVIQYLTGS